MDFQAIAAEVSESQGLPIGYHNGNTKDPERDSSGRKRAPAIEERRVIAWDMEGMNLSGEGKPQHPVVFGCSAEVETPLVGQRLSTQMMLDYIIAVGKRNPHAIHVGYGFRYDANMIIQDFSEKEIIRLYKDGSIRYNTPDGAVWRLRWIPGKTLTITRRHGKAKDAKTTVTINDYSSFFGLKFIDTCEKILGDELSDTDRKTIEHGKAERGNTTWEDLAEVLHYWRAEIVLMERVFARFRDVMCKAGFPLRDWYGPGALANAIISNYKMRPKMAGAQTTSGAMPDAVHQASKHAFFGGRFELFQAGRTTGPIFAVDIGSAYPHALRMVPDLSPDKGEWVHVSNPSRIERFGFYRIRYSAPGARINETRPMPLPWRDFRGMITFPPSVLGWYASPEAKMLIGTAGTDIIEGWYWQPHGKPEFPWQFLEEMYARRQKIGKKNLMSMPFKLGPNSIYGKLAQTVGWNKEKFLPPRSHALPIAAWVTSMCRAMLYTAMRRQPDAIIAVETDSIITTANPATLGIKIGDALGEWEVTEYEEIVYVQSGMYHVKKDGKWLGTKSRGLQASEYTIETAESYLRDCLPDSDLDGYSWPPLKLSTKPRFIGAGAARASSEPFKEMHCVWKEQTREIGIGTTGKRRHIPAMCDACQRGVSPWDEPHRLIVMSKSEGTTISAPRKLPWEKQEHPAEVQEIRERLEIESDQMTSG
jgi:hypothetical protein